MLVLHVGLSQSHLSGCHGKVGVTEHFLQREDASSSSEEHHGEGMPEGMRGTAGGFYLANIAQSLNQLQ